MISLIVQVTTNIMFIDTTVLYLQLFRRYKRKIYILGVLGFLKTTRSFPKIPERSPKSSEEVRSLLKTSEAFRSLRTCINASSLQVLFTSKIRDREEGIVIYSFYTWFSFLTWVWVNIFLEIVSSKTATTHIFQSGVRNWPAGVSWREIEVFNLQAWDSRTPKPWELAGIPTWMRGNLVLRLWNRPKLPSIHARFYCNANEQSVRWKGLLFIVAWFQTEKT